MKKKESVEIAESHSVVAAAKSENRKVTQILSAAADLFLNQGYDASSMDAIAQAAGVSKSTLYSRFSNKETLFVALVETECMATADRLRPPSLGSSDFEACLRQLASQFTDLFLDPRGMAMHRLIFAEAARFPEIGDVFVKWGPHRARRLIADFLREAREQELIDLPDPDLAALHFLSLVVGDLPMERQLGIAPRSAKEMKRLVDSGMALFMKGYSVKSDGISMQRKPKHGNKQSVA